MLTAAGGWQSAGGWLLVVRVFGLINLGFLLLSLTPVLHNKDDALKDANEDKK
jgi:hypothetical protein